MLLVKGRGRCVGREIERLNIYHASHLAMRRALARIDTYDHVLVDGRKIVGFQDQVGPYTSIVDGDASSPTPSPALRSSPRSPATG